MSSSRYCHHCGTANTTGTLYCFACNTPLLTSPTSNSVQLVSGTLFQDRYRLLGKVGTGGFGSVYKAVDTYNQDYPVAIKEVCLQGLKPQAVLEATDTFHREVTLLSHLVHPHLPRLHAHFIKAEHLYVIMDFIEGETLEEHLNKGCLPLSKVLAIGLQLCTALDYLHTQEPPIIFRDLKPANIMYTLQGQVYLIDFGIARYFKPGQTKDTIALGSLGYAAPEQYGKAQTTPQTDIYSLGAVLHQLLTGEDPSEAPFQFRPLRVNSLLNLSDLTTLIEEMVDMNMYKRPASIALVQEKLQHIANVWKAVNIHYWQPKSYHEHVKQVLKS